MIDALEGGWEDKLAEFTWLVTMADSMRKLDAEDVADSTPEGTDAAEVAELPVVVVVVTKLDPVSEPKEAFGPNPELDSWLALACVEAVTVGVAEATVDWADEAPKEGVSRELKSADVAPKEKLNELTDTEELDAAVLAAVTEPSEELVEADEPTGVAEFVGAGRAADVGGLSGVRGKPVDVDALISAAELAVTVGPVDKDIPVASEVPLGCKELLTIEEPANDERVIDAVKLAESALGLLDGEGLAKAKEFIVEEGLLVVD